MNCEYCGTTGHSGERCDKCGAKLPEKAQDVWKSEPFFYNGYICYSLRHPMTDSCEIQFWLGRELIERIEVTRDLLDYHVPKGRDPMPFFWDLFLLAHGEKDVIEWQEKNKKYPAMFKITRIENPEKERRWALSMQDLAQEARR